MTYTPSLREIEERLSEGMSTSADLRFVLGEVNKLVAALWACRNELLSFAMTVTDNDVVTERLNRLLDAADEALKVAGLKTRPNLGQTAKSDLRNHAK